MSKQPTEIRNGTYPYYNFRRCLLLAETVKEYGGGRSDVAKPIVAQHLRMGESSASLSQLLTSAKCFGMIVGNRSYSLTETAQRFFFPTNESDRRLAELDFLAAPTAFRFLIDRFDGSRLPAVEMMVNLLRREASVPKSWAGRVAGIFQASAGEMGVIDLNGFLRYGAAKVSVDTGQMTESANGSQPPGAENRAPSGAAGASLSISDAFLRAQSLAVPLREVSQRKPGGNVWIFNEGEETVRLETPSQLSRALWERLKKYVEILEPSESRKEGL